MFIKRKTYLMLNSVSQFQPKRQWCSHGFFLLWANVSLDWWKKKDTFYMYVLQFQWALQTVWGINISSQGNTPSLYPICQGFSPDWLTCWLQKNSLIISVNFFLFWGAWGCGGEWGCLLIISIAHVFMNTYWHSYSGQYWLAHLSFLSLVSPASMALTHHWGQLSLLVVSCNTQLRVTTMGSR